MLSVNEYIKLILKKKGWTNVRLCQELNKIEQNLGDSRTTVQNITNYLNNGHALRPKFLSKIEKALDLPFGSLSNMVEPISSKEGQKELKKLINKLKEVK